MSMKLPYMPDVYKHIVDEEVPGDHFNLGPGNYYQWDINKSFDIFKNKNKLNFKTNFSKEKRF